MQCMWADSTPEMMAVRNAAVIIFLDSTLPHHYHEII